MTYRAPGRLEVAAEARSPQLVPSSVLGMIVFVITEVMLFAGFISAFSIVRAGSPLWPPPGQPRLPVETTAFNTAVLLLSGVVLILARRSFQQDRERCGRLLLGAIALGGFFVVAQGREWVALLGQGLTLTSSALGSFFFLIIGLHALHVVIAMGLLVRAWRRLRGGWIASSQLATAEVFWYFVVGVWPVLYLTVYL